jgi:hypothetical protein
VGKTLKELIPNSTEWLSALEKINPQQAAMTRAVLAQSGSEEVCSICGDTPARDYDLPGVPLRGRFCDDCKKIQSAI